MDNFNKRNVKKAPWSYALVAASCSAFFCLLADPMITKMILFKWQRYDDELYMRMHYGMDSQQHFLCVFLLNFFLMAMGSLVAHFHKDNKELKGKKAILAMPVILEGLAVFILYHVWRGWGSIVLWIVVFMCIIAAVLMGYFIPYKVRTYVICCVVAVILSVSCMLLVMEEIERGTSTVGDLRCVIFVLQPFAVLFPAISFIRGIISTPATDDVINQEDTVPLAESTGNTRIYCPFCGREQEAGGRFCCQCGRELAPELFIESSQERHCPLCGVKVEAGMLFCKECGTKMP